MKNPFRLRPAAPADIPYLLDLETRCMRPHAEALWGAFRPREAAEIDPSTHHILSLPQAQTQTQTPGPAGCVSLLWRPTHLWIDKLYLEPALQNQGLGARLLQALTAQAEARALPTRLSVLSTNPALRLYLRHGFEIEDQDPERIRLRRPLPASSPG